MRRLVFWKILLGFWITTLLITQGVWLMYTLLRPMPQTDELPRGFNVASVAATAIIEKQGVAALNRQMQSWPRDVRRQIIIAPAASGDTGSIVSDPQGQQYRIVPRPNRRDRGRGGHGALDVPWEVLVVSLFGGLVFSAILAWYLTAPIQRIRKGFDRLAKGDFTTRLQPQMGRRRDEIADLVRDFDVMARRLEELVGARDRLLADVSHELRSPLARLQLAIGLARQDPAKVEASLDRISREAARLDEMVGELLSLAKLESGANHDDYFDFADVVRAVADDATFEAGPLGVEVSVDIASADLAREWLVLGNGKLISHAVENIVRNALRFSRRGDRVSLKLDLHEAGFFRLKVADNGPGVPDEMLAALFKPFVQGSGDDGQGYGLGLAIAERAIIAHGGSISAENEAGAGLTVTASLPAARI